MLLRRVVVLACQMSSRAVFRRHVDPVRIGSSRVASRRLVVLVCLMSSRAARLLQELELRRATNGRLWDKDARVV